MLSPEFFCMNPVDPNRAYPEGGAMSEMRYACTKILIVTRYRGVRNAVVPSFCLRFRFTSGSLLSMEHQRTYNGPRTDLKRRELKVLARLNKQKQVPYLINLLP